VTLRSCQINCDNYDLSRLGITVIISPIVKYRGTRGPDCSTRLWITRILDIRHNWRYMTAGNYTSIRESCRIYSRRSQPHFRPIIDARPQYRPHYDNYKLALISKHCVAYNWPTVMLLFSLQCANKRTKWAHLIIASFWNIRNIRIIDHSKKFLKLYIYFFASHFSRGSQSFKKIFIFYYNLILYIHSNNILCLSALYV